MWIVKIALERPYTFIVLALLILILSPVVILNTPTDIFPNIDIPVVAVSWTFTGMNPEELEGRLTTVYEKVLTTLVDNIEHIESTTVNGTVVVKIFLQPTASVDRANAQVTAASQTILRQLPPGTLPPLIVNYTASSVPILQLALSGPGLSESDLNDLALNFLRPQLVTVPGAAVPYPYGGKQREVMVNLDSGLLQSKGLSPQDIVNAVERAKCHRAVGNREDRSIRVRRRHQLRAKNGRGNERPPGQSGRQLDDLSPRCLPRERWLHPTDQHRSAGWPPRRPDHRDQRRRRVDAQRCRRHSRPASPRAADASAATQDSTASGPVRLRSRRHQRRRAGSLASRPSSPR